MDYMVKWFKISSWQGCGLNSEQTSWSKWLAKSIQKKKELAVIRKQLKQARPAESVVIGSNRWLDGWIVSLTKRDENNQNT